MTPAEIIVEVRKLVNDSRVPFRYSDIDMLGFVNQTLKRMVVLRPDLFVEYGEIPTVANSPLQALPGDSMRLVELYQVKDGNTLTEVNRETMDQGYPNWVSDPAGVPYNFMRHVRNPNRYFLYPRPIPGVILLGEYVKVPIDYNFDSEIAILPDAYFSAVVDGTVFLASSVDDEHVNSGRAKAFLDSFTQNLGTSLQARELIDSETAALPAKGVI
jgi:hypothetical protein